jgi:hypothetical protein
MQIKATELIWDQTIYPRTDVNSIHVGVLADALRVGEKLPSLVVEKKTNRIVDGVSRWHAHRKVFGDTCLIECEERKYASDKELFLDAIKLNTAHGLVLDQCEKTKCALTLEQMGVTREQIMQVLRVTAETYERLTARTAFRAGQPNERVPLKSSMASLSGRTLTSKQESTNNYVGGMRPLYYVNCVVGFIESGMCKDGTAELMDALSHLRDLLMKVVPKKAKAA